MLDRNFWKLSETEVAVLISVVAGFTALGGAIDTQYRFSPAAGLVRPAPLEIIVPKQEDPGLPAPAPSPAASGTVVANAGNQGFSLPPITVIDPPDVSLPSPGLRIGQMIGSFIANLRAGIAGAVEKYSAAANPDIRRFSAYSPCPRCSKIEGVARAFYVDFKDYAREIPDLTPSTLTNATVTRAQYEQDLERLGSEQITICQYVDGREVAYWRDPQPAGLGTDHPVLDHFENRFSRMYCPPLSQVKP